MKESRITRRLALSAFAGSFLALAGCGDSSTAAPAEVKEGGGTPTAFDNPPLGDPLAPSQAELNAKRPRKTVARPRR